MRDRLRCCLLVNRDARCRRGGVAALVGCARRDSIALALGECGQVPRLDAYSPGPVARDLAGVGLAIQRDRDRLTGEAPAAATAGDGNAGPGVLGIDDALGVNDPDRDCCTHVLLRTLVKIDCREVEILGQILPVRKPHYPAFPLR